MKKFTKDRQKKAKMMLGLSVFRSFCEVLQNGSCSFPDLWHTGLRLAYGLWLIAWQFVLSCHFQIFQSNLPNPVCPKCLWMTPTKFTGEVNTDTKELPHASAFVECSLISSHSADCDCPIHNVKVWWKVVKNALNVSRFQGKKFRTRGVKHCQVRCRHHRR